MKKKTQPDGLFDQLAKKMAVSAMLPDFINHLAGALVSVLPLPEEAAGAKALMAKRNRRAAMACGKAMGKWILNARDAHKNGQKVILAPFNFPTELIHAFDRAVPLTSEMLTTAGVIALPDNGEQYWDLAMGLGLPDHICSANTIELGSMLEAGDFMPQAMIQSTPGACDVNAKIHEFVAHYHDIPQFFLQKPPVDSERGFNTYVLYMKELVRQLEEFLGEELTEEKLRVMTEKANRCTELFHEIWDLHKAHPCPIPNLFALFVYGIRFSMWGTDEGITALETLADEGKRRLAAKAYPAPQEVARCMWCYTSYYFDPRMFTWMEEKGYSYMGDGLSLCFPEIIDPSSRDTMLEGLARAAWNMPMTRQMGSESMSRSWSNDVVWAAKEMEADCVIFCGHHSCKQTWSVVSILREELERRAGLPLLVLQGDAWIKKMTPMSVIQQEIDEFIRNVVIDQGRGKRKVRRRKARAVES